MEEDLDRKHFHPVYFLFCFNFYVCLNPVAFLIDLTIFTNDDKLTPRPLKINDIKKICKQVNTSVVVVIRVTSEAENFRFVIYYAFFVVIFPPILILSIYNICSKE